MHPAKAVYGLVLCVCPGDLQPWPKLYQICNLLYMVSHKERLLRSPQAYTYTEEKKVFQSSYLVVTSPPSKLLGICLQKKVLLGLSSLITEGSFSNSQPVLYHHGAMELRKPEIPAGCIGQEGLHISFCHQRHRDTQYWATATLVSSSLLANWSC